MSDIYLSELVEIWNVWDDIYIKNIWFDTETHDVVHVMDNMYDAEDIEDNYIDIENNFTTFHCMPTRDKIDKLNIMQMFINDVDIPVEKKDDLRERLTGIMPYEEFKDIIYDLNLDKKWNQFRDKYSAKILLDWANEEEIPVIKDMETLSDN